MGKGTLWDEPLHCSSSSSPGPERALQTLTCPTQVHQSAKALRWIMQALQGSGFSSEEDMPHLGKHNPSSTAQRNARSKDTALELGSPTSLSISPAEAQHLPCEALLSLPCSLQQDFRGKGVGPGGEA